MELRQFAAGDIDEVIRLFADTVHAVNCKDYTPAQINAWVSSAAAVDKEHWLKSLLAHDALVTLADGSITGFGDMGENGYLDRLYVHKNYQGMGIATTLYKALEQRAQNRGCLKIITYASITANPFFKKQGFVVVRQNEVKRKGVTLINYLMEKSLQEKSLQEKTVEKNT